MEASEVFANVRPFTGLPEVQQQEAPAVLAEATAQREIAEVQAAMIIAKRFPRNQAKATDRIMVACQRPTLAEGALYTYARGGTDITGPSIRLAEAIAQQWGNLQFGIRELEQRLGESTVEAYAWDLETNTRQTKTFQVKHIRRTRAKGNYALEDPRDIYEMVANQGARRLRACILGVIPGDVVEAAVNQCEDTLKAKADISPDAVKKMVEVFSPYGVSKEMIETRIQRKIDSITPAQIISLRKVYNSLKDGMSTASDWFEAIPEPDITCDKKKSCPKPKTTAPDHAGGAQSPTPEQSNTGSEVKPTSDPSIGPRGIRTVQIDVIMEHINRTGYELPILLQDFEVTELTELTDEAGSKAIEFLAKQPSV
jgi:hypothetical protein